MPSKPQATVTPRSLPLALPLPLSLPPLPLSLCPHSAAALGHGGRYTKPMRKIEYENRSRSREKKTHTQNKLAIFYASFSALLLFPPLLLLLLFVCLLQRCLSWRFVFQLRFVFFSRQLQFGSATRHCVGQIGNAWKCR